MEPKEQKPFQVLLQYGAELIPYTKGQYRFRHPNGKFYSVDLSACSEENCIVEALRQIADEYHKRGMSDKQAEIKHVLNN